MIIFDLVFFNRFSLLSCNKKKWKIDQNNETKPPNQLILISSFHMYLYDKFKTLLVVSNETLGLLIHIQLETQRDQFSPGRRYCLITMVITSSNANYELS